MPNKENIEVVTMDMWNPYRTAVNKVIPNAKRMINFMGVDKYESNNYNQ